MCAHHSLLWILLLLFGEYSLESMLTPVIFHETVCYYPMNCYYEIEICLSDSNESRSALFGYCSCCLESTVLSQC